MMFVFEISLRFAIAKPDCGGKEVGSGGGGGAVKGLLPMCHHKRFTEKKGKRLGGGRGGGGWGTHVALPLAGAAANARAALTAARRDARSVALVVAACRLEVRGAQREVRQGAPVKWCALTGLGTLWVAQRRLP